MLNKVKFDDFVIKNFNLHKYMRNNNEFILSLDLDDYFDYYIVNIKKGDEIFKKYYIIDTRNLSPNTIKCIFNHIYTIQRDILNEDFFKFSSLINKNNYSIYPLNMELIFLGNDEVFKFVNKNEILNDMNYALKSFMSEDELNEYIKRKWNFKNIGKEKLIKLNDKTIKLNHFNYIVGYNATGKTTLLKEIADKTNSPVFNMNDNNYYGVHNVIAVQKFIYSLTGKNYVDEYSSYGKYVKRMAQILQYCIEHNKMVLLDDLNWNSLDSRSFIKLINTLADYSYEKGSVVLTGYDKENFIKKKVYKPNIIYTNNY